MGRIISGVVRKERRRKDLMKIHNSIIVAEIDICWENEKTNSEQFAYINSKLGDFAEKIKVFSKRIDGVYVNRWVWSTEEKDTIDVNEVLDKVLLQFSKKVDELNEIRKTLDAHITLEIIIEMKKSGTTPALYFEKEVLDFLHEIEGTIDVDMYIV